MNKDDRKKDHEDLLNTLKENAENWVNGTTKPEPSISSSILLPMIRKTMPGLISQQIVGIQPMSTPSGMMYGMTSIFDTIIKTCMEVVEIDDVMVEYYAVKIPYGYFPKNNVEIHEIYEWCNKTFGDELITDRWNMRNTKTFLFKNEEDRNWFLLRWSS